MRSGHVAPMRGASHRAAHREKMMRAPALRLVLLLAAAAGRSLAVPPAKVPAPRRWGLRRARSDGAAPRAPGRRRLLMLISDTGGGHRASAEAIGAMIEQLRPGQVEVSVVDIWTEYAPWTSFPYNRMVPIYRFLGRHSGAPLWRFVWRMMFWGSICWEHPWDWTMWWACGRRFTRCVREYDPDLVVSLHPCCQHCPLRAVRAVARERRRAQPVPFATVCTDLDSAHPAWFHKRVDACFVATDKLGRAAARRGVDARAV